MADLYDGFITSLQSRKKRKPRYNSIGLPILPPEPKPRVDVIGLPKRDTREQLLRTKANILDFLSKWGHRREELEDMVVEGSELEAVMDTQAVRKLNRLQALEQKRKRGEKLTSEEWRRYSDWTKITNELLEKITGGKMVDLMTIQDYEDIPEQFKEFVRNPKSKPYILASSSTEGMFGEGSIGHATLFLRHITKDTEGHIVVVIEHYDPSGREQYEENEELGNAVSVLVEYAGSKFEEANIQFDFIPPTEKSYQNSFTSLACARMCILRMLERDKHIDEFVQHFEGQPTYFTDEITAELLNKHEFHDKYYPEIETDLLKYKAVLDAHAPKYTKRKAILYSIQKAPSVLAQIEEYLPDAPSEETPA